MSPSVNGRTALWREALCFDMLLQHGSVVNREDYLGYIPLHMGAKGCPFPTTARLIAAGADINLRGTKFGVTPLSFAARVDQMQTIQYLLDHGAQLEAVDIRGKTVLGFAVAYNAHKTIPLLLRGRANYLHITNDGSALLHIAASLAVVETLDLILRANLSGLDVSCKNHNGFTPSELFEERKPVLDVLRHTFSRLLQVVEAADVGDSITSDEHFFEDALEYISDT
jgi:ankyrin repeat protein